jgi:hypothetical protein
VGGIVPLPLNTRRMIDMTKVSKFKPTQHNVQFNGLIHNAKDVLEIEDTDLIAEIDRGRHTGTKKPMSTLLAYFEPIEMTEKGEKAYEDFMADINRQGKKVKKAERVEEEKEVKAKEPTKKDMIEAINKHNEGMTDEEKIEIPSNANKDTLKTIMDDNKIEVGKKE